jgi:hypothetical protein
MLKRKHIEDNQWLRVERDPRADEGKRRVRVTGEKVFIARRFAGISMYIGVPVSAYRGVALDVRPAEHGGARYFLSLAHPDPDLDVLLAETGNSAAVAADWRYWASSLGLPRLARENGTLETVEPRANRLAAHGALARRRNAAIAKRRPRFSRRRKSGVAARLGTVFAGEREIIGYE